MSSPRHDIFISYTHNDNVPPDEDQKGWVELFHRSLLALIKQIYDKDINIWRDPKTHGNDIIEKDVRQKIAAAHLLVAILSPKYLTSRWCLRELRWFVRSAKYQEVFHNTIKSPIFKVAKTRTERKHQPRIIRGMPGYDFYLYDETTDYITHFKQGRGVPYDPRYWDNLDKLAQDIVKVLKKALAEHTETPPTESPGKVVYLAEPTPDLQSEHKRIKDELMTRRYRVFPEEPLPTESPQLRSLIRNYLRRSRLSVHLVGKNYLELPESERENSVVRLQNNLAAERLLRSDFSRLIWVPDEMQVTDQLQVELVSHGDQRWLAGTEFLQSSLDELKTVTLEKLEGKARRAPVSSPPAHKTVYLVYDQQDQENIDLIYQCLFNLGYELTTSSFEGDIKSVARHKSKLATCDAVLIYYGKGNQDWLESHLDYLEAARGIKSMDERESGVSKPLLAKAIYVAPPFTGHKQIFNTRRAKVIKIDEAFECEHLTGFFDQIDG